MSVYFAPLWVHNTIDRFLDNLVDSSLEETRYMRISSDQNLGLIAGILERLQVFADKDIPSYAKYNLRAKIFNVLTVAAAAALTISTANFIFSSFSPASAILTIAIIYARAVMKENMGKSHISYSFIRTYDDRPLTGWRDFFLKELG